MRSACTWSPVVTVIAVLQHQNSIFPGQNELHIQHGTARCFGCISAQADVTQRCKAQGNSMVEHSGAACVQQTQPSFDKKSRGIHVAFRLWRQGAQLLDSNGSRAWNSNSCCRIGSSSTNSSGETASSPSSSTRALISELLVNTTTMDVKHPPCCCFCKRYIPCTTPTL